MNGLPFSSTFLLRTTPSRFINMLEWKESLRYTLAHLSMMGDKAEITDSNLLQASLSTRHGGLDMKGDDEFARICYYSSCKQSSLLVQIILHSIQKNFQFFYPNFFKINFSKNSFPKKVIKQINSFY